MAPRFLVLLSGCALSDRGVFSSVVSWVVGTWEVPRCCLSLVCFLFGCFIFFLCQLGFSSVVVVAFLRIRFAFFV